MKVSEMTDKKLKFGDKLIEPTGIRVLNEMRGVIYDKKWLKKANLKLEIYYMYRDLAVNLVTGRNWRQLM